MSQPLVKASELRYCDHFILDGASAIFVGSYTNIDGEFVIAYRSRSVGYRATRRVLKRDTAITLVERAKLPNLIATWTAS